MRMAAIWLLAVCCGVATARADERVQAKLVADVSAIRPGASFTLGVLFQIKEGWHVYWQNPGEAGLPTKVKFTLAEGFSASGVQYPIPADFTPVGGATTYGYEKSVMLLAEVQAPKELDVGKPVTIEATASWLACREVCIPGSAKLSMALEVREESQAVNEDLFQNWRKKLPVTADMAQGVRVVRITGGAPSATSRPFEMQLGLDSIPKRVEFFPLTAEALVVEGVKIEQSEGPAQASIRFQVRQLPGAQKPAGASLPGVVVLIDQKGDRRGIRVDFPLADSR